nr:hypothetical protein [Tanacetum cinerariifolium]
MLAIIESKSKMRYSRSRVTDSRVSMNAPLTSSSPSHSFDLQQIAASPEDKLNIRMNHFEKSLNDMKASFITPTAPIKAVEESAIPDGRSRNFIQGNHLSKAFEKLMKDKFHMSSMGEFTFFLGLQVKQKVDEIFISQDKYVPKFLRKFGLTNEKSASTPIDTEKPLLKDPDGEDVDIHTYKSMIGSLMYPTSSRPDIMFAICTCACFQVTPKASHLHAVKRIFSDYAGASLNRKSTTGGCQFLDQTVSGKDSSNPLMANNLPKIVWYSTHHVALIKSWLVQKQTDLGQMATGKENSNPFMADSLPKTILLTFIHGICINMVLLNSYLSI